MPHAMPQGKLRVGAAVGVGEGTEERVELLVQVRVWMPWWWTRRTAIRPA